MNAVNKICEILNKNNKLDNDEINTDLPNEKLTNVEDGKNQMIIVTTFLIYQLNVYNSKCGQVSIHLNIINF